MNALRSASRLAGLVALSAAMSGTAAAQERCDAVRVDVVPRVVRLGVGSQLRLAATAYDAAGIPCRPGAADVRLTTSNRHIATVAEDGLVTGHAPGIAIVVARAEGVQRPATATVLVGLDAREIYVVPALPESLRVRPPRVPTPGRTIIVDSLRVPRAPLPPMRATSNAARADYARILSLHLAGTLSSLVSTLRSAAGVPLAGATSPDLLSSRERARWERCRALSEEIRARAETSRALRESGSLGSPDLDSALAALDSTLRSARALRGCEAVAELIRDPAGTADWARRYGEAASGFYGLWQTEVRAIDEANRTLARALGTWLPGALPSDAPEAWVFRTGPWTKVLAGGVPSGVRWDAADAAAAFRPADDSTVLGPSEVGAVRAGQAVRGRLEHGDRMMTDGALADLWGIEARAGQLLMVELRSGSFDAYLQLLGPDGARMAEDDDSLGQRNSRVAVTVPADGRYWLVVTEFSPRPLPGYYRLTVR